MNEIPFSEPVAEKIIFYTLKTGKIAENIYFLIYLHESQSIQKNMLLNLNQHEGGDHIYIVQYYCIVHYASY